MFTEKYTILKFNSRQIYKLSVLANTKRKFLSQKQKMDKPLCQEDFAAMEHQLRGSMEEDRRAVRVNDVKCDAIHTARTYEEFADRVAAAHLQPLDKKDYKSKAAKAWNQYAAKDKDFNE